MYRQTLEEHGLSLEQGTPAVPDDGYYHVIFKGEIVGRFKSLTKALLRYREIKGTLNLQPAEFANVSIEEMRLREMESMSNKRLIWTDEDFTRVQKKTQGKKGTRSSG